MHEIRSQEDSCKTCGEIVYSSEDMMGEQETQMDALAFLVR